MGVDFDKYVVYFDGELLDIKSFGLFRTAVAIIWTVFRYHDGKFKFAPDPLMRELKKRVNIEFKYNFVDRTLFLMRDMNFLRKEGNMFILNSDKCGIIRKEKKK